MFHTIRRFCILVIGLSMSAIAWAQSLYQVEVIVFERKVGAYAGASQTSDGHNLAYMENAQVLKTQEPTDAQTAQRSLCWPIVN